MGNTPQDPGDTFGQGAPISGFDNENSTQPRPWFKKKRFAFPLVLFLFFVALGIAVGNDHKESPKAPTAVGTEKPSGRTTTSKVPASTSPLLTTPAPTTSTTRPAANPSGILPDLRGQDLQAAQDSAQASGFYALKSHDVTGQERLQIYDRNWKVCSQSPTAGAHEYDTVVDFGVVKDEESCPSVEA